ncbi:glycosyltransferase [Marinomonas pontica]|uniref:glycosyltransferase family 2 protein n=1 Tax=Marinomonas pontica TaxID=264739 RepID=UPI0022446508|nr:glycosyltransferase family 2 protein [Marinomonas pontica]MCW8354477.1 glycosyltransferase [Marinomonas pontica]
MKKISVIINNYNYSQYLDECINSVLSQSYNDFELIIVDDGSTDDSRVLLSKYSDYAKLIFKNNGGQGSAYNIGFSESVGDLILFLDSDDLLLKDALSIISNEWVLGAAKLHFKLQVINELSEKSNFIFPETLDKGDLKDLVIKYGSYSSPPASGNVYSRECLKTLLPLHQDDWKIAADSYLIFLSPFCGDVIEVNQALALYRIDYSRKNDLPSKLVFNNSPSTPWAAYERSILTKNAILKSIKEKFDLDYQFDITPPPIDKLRLISFKLFKDKHPTHDSFFRILRSSFRGVVSWPAYSKLKKIFVFMWFLLVAFLPRKLALCLCRKSIVNPFES